eukprot:CAMPEP_0195039316 /NCGR_PEP_ID=MMETSP0326_2-20130528/79444_1 /TAXON_ID=2866 ORGANISM="Crypthecodinium cohnii, Strain Seligo" /NCGR_SAMPLE_ID=MMETSP0326_2 /ASSEMBLY_ACC=CAM_ASM_000348 /LENGTH=77 /DNA_ID=CAMNT_0040066095 /DNA_START=174 /DNA_END=407 /DNA_ORIENTATION=+
MRATSRQADADIYESDRLCSSRITPQGRASLASENLEHGAAQTTARGFFASFSMTAAEAAVVVDGGDVTLAAIVAAS